MPSKIQINADLVACQVDVTAKAGDLLLVYNGNCLGVYRGLTELPKPAIAKRSIVKLPFTEQDVLAALSHGYQNSMRIADRLGIDRKDRRTRAHLSIVVKNLAAASKIRARPGTVRNHVWELIS